MLPRPKDSAKREMEAKRGNTPPVGADQPLLDMGTSWGSEEDALDRDRGRRYYSRQREYKDSATISHDWASNFHNSKYNLQNLYHQNLYYNHSSYFRHHQQHYYRNSNSSPWQPHHHSSKREEPSDHFRRDSSSVVLHGEDERHDSISSTGSVVSRYPKEDCDMWRADDRRCLEPESCSSPRGFSFRWRPEAPWGSTSFSHKARDEEEDDSIGSTVIHHSDSLSLGSADDVRDSSLDHPGRHDWQLALLIGRHQNWLQQQQQQQHKSLRKQPSEKSSRTDWERGVSDEEEDVPHGPSDNNSLSSERVNKNVAPPPGSAPPSIRAGSLASASMGATSSGRHAGGNVSPKGAFSRGLTGSALCRAPMRSSVRTTPSGSSGWNPRPSSWGTRYISARSGSFSPKVRGFDESEMGGLCSSSGRNRSTSGGAVGSNMPRLKIETELSRTRSVSNSAVCGGGLVIENSALSDGHDGFENLKGHDQTATPDVDQSSSESIRDNPVAELNNNRVVASKALTSFGSCLRPQGETSESKVSNGSGASVTIEAFQPPYVLNDKRKSKVTFALPHSSFLRRPGAPSTATLQPPPPSPPSSPTPSSSISPQAATVRLGAGSRRSSSSASFSTTTSSALAPSMVVAPAVNVSTFTFTCGSVLPSVPASASPSRSSSGEASGLVLSNSLDTPSLPQTTSLSVVSPLSPPPSTSLDVVTPDGHAKPQDSCGCTCVLL